VARPMRYDQLLQAVIDALPPHFEQGEKEGLTTKQLAKRTGVSVRKMRKVVGDLLDDGAIEFGRLKREPDIMGRMMPKRTYCLTAEEGEKDGDEEDGV